MIEKTYFVGRLKEEFELAGNFLLGIYGRREGTIPFLEGTPKGVKNDVTTRLFWKCPAFDHFRNS